MKRLDEMVLKDLIAWYNVLACPSMGVPKLTPDGNKSKKGLIVRKPRHSNLKVTKN